MGIGTKLILIVPTATRKSEPIRSILLMKPGVAHCTYPFASKQFQTVVEHPQRELRLHHRELEEIFQLLQ